MPHVTLLYAAFAAASGLACNSGPSPTAAEPPPPPADVAPRIRSGLPAFPGAQGGGAMAAGGRGRCAGGVCSGRAIQVTSLADSGPGSLRACVAAVGPRTCVFTVAGEVALTSALEITARNSELTIAGQTAPGGGITITGKSLSNPSSAMVYVSDGAHDVVLRYLRLRRLLDPRCASGGVDCQGILHTYGPIRDVLVDHVSASWSVDDAIFNLVGAGATRNVTWSWILAAESFNAGGDTQNTAGMIYGTSPGAANAMVDLDIHHSVLTNFGHRLPVWAAGRLRHVANIMHPYGDRATWIGGGSSAELVNNFWKPGPGTSRSKLAEIILIVPPTPYSNYPDLNQATPRLFLSGNVGPNGTGDEWGLTHQTPDLNARGRGRGARGYVHPAPASFKGGRLPPLDAPIREDPVGSDGAALERLLWITGSDGYGPVGASRRVDCEGRFVDARDPFDEGAYSRYRDNSGFEPSSEEDARYAPTRSRWSEVKAALAGGTPCADGDADGVPDAYEDANGLDRSNPADAARQAPDGYTWLERYLNGR